MVKRHGKYRKHKKITSSTIKEPQSVYVKRTQKKELLDFLRTISGTRVSHTKAYLESHLALPSKCYSDTKQPSFTVRLGKVDVHQVSMTGRKRKPFGGGQSARSFPAFDALNSTEDYAVPFK